MTEPGAPFEIFKIQKSIYPPNETLLIYNEDCSVFVQWMYFEGIEEFLQGELKCYVYATVIHDEITIDSIAPWQEW